VIGTEPSTSPGDPPAQDPSAQLAQLQSWLLAAGSFGRLTVWERDLQTGQGRWAPEIFDLFGLPRASRSPDFDEAMGRIHARDRDRVAEVFARSLAHAGRHETRYRIVHADGSLRYVHSLWEVPADGRRVTGVLIDDTESVRQAQEHEVTRMHLSMVSRLVGMSLWRRELATGRVLRGEQIWQRGGAPPAEGCDVVAEVRGRIHPEDWAVAEQADQRALDGDEPADAEIRYDDPADGVRTLMTRRLVQRDEDGRPVAIVGAGMDITEQVTARERYRDLLERFDTLVEGAGVGMWTRDLATGEIEWNEPLRRIYGLAPGDPLPFGPGAVVSSPIVAEHRARAAEAMRETLDPQGPDRVEITFDIVRPDGQRRQLVSRARRIESSRPLACGVVIDVTDVQRAEQALRDKAAAEQASRAKSAFLSRMSHELRTPLNAVLGFTELLLHDPILPPAPVQRERLQHVLQAARHLLGLVDDVLDLQDDRDRPGVDLSRCCDLGHVIDQVLAWNADQARNAGVQLHAAGDRPVVIGAERHWRQVLANLVSNAIKYNRRGGQVTVSAGHGERDGQAWMEIRDSGQGIPAARLPQLFEPFNRLGAEAAGIPGTGLGLSIVRQIVESLGGTVVVDSEAGVGTRVRVTMQRAVSPAMAPSDPAEVPGPGAAAQPRADIVYVEDNPVNVLLVREILAQRPRLRLHVATTVAEALAIVPRVQPALLLVDLHLPDGSGHELLARLRAQGPLPAQHCVALSADALPDEVARSLAGGFEAHWVKPIDLVGFLAGVDHLLGEGEGGESGGSAAPGPAPPLASPASP